MNLNILDLGLKDFGEVLKIQYELVEKRFHSEISDTVILVEHPHVFTVGRKSDSKNIHDKSIPVFKTERGGDITYHGPGQIVAYPIINIEKKKDVHFFLRTLEEIIIATLRNYNLYASRREKFTGVWVNEKKIASIGVSFKNWISFHGLALNVSTDLSYFYKINPCGLESSVMTSMEELLKTKVEIIELKNILIDNFKKIMLFD